MSLEISLLRCRGRIHIVYAAEFIQYHWQNKTTHSFSDHSKSWEITEQQPHLPGPIPWDSQPPRVHPSRCLQLVKTMKVLAELASCCVHPSNSFLTKAVLYKLCLVEQVKKASARKTMPFLVMHSSCFPGTSVAPVLEGNESFIVCEVEELFWNIFQYSNYRDTVDTGAELWTNKWQQLMWNALKRWNKDSILKLPRDRFWLSRRFLILQPII